MESKVATLIIGAGPAGLSCALRLKTLSPSREVVVIDKAEAPGNHALSGAVMDAAPLESLLDQCVPRWRDDAALSSILARRVTRDDILLLLGKKGGMRMTPLVAAAGALGMSVGQMLHTNNAIVSVSRLTRALASCARDKGVEVLHGFGAKELLWDETTKTVRGVRLCDQGLEADGSRLASFLAGETILADTVVLAEGCDGPLTEQLVRSGSLSRRHVPLFSVGIKEIIQVPAKTYEAFGDGRVVHALGYPLWTPLLGPSLFGGGIVYAMGENRLAVGMIVGLDWKYADFNPQDALRAFKEHAFINQYVSGGTSVEAGAKMIPEGGLRSLPRDKEGSLGCGNALLLGDGAGLVNMIKIRGLHNAIESGMHAAKAIAENAERPAACARAYTDLLDKSNVGREMRQAAKFRQAVAKLGPAIGLPLSALGGLAPDFSVEEDYRAMRPRRKSPIAGAVKFDKMSFVAMSGSRHREGQPSHLTILSRQVCDDRCRTAFGCPCITFCPAGVYEDINGEVKPANPSNCLHCKTCQRKCPLDNIRWTVPEGGGGPRYSDM